jgi:hypothetical protein
MGVLLMLGIHYFVTLSHNKSSNRAPASLDYQTRLGPILVSLSIFFNLVQTILDMVRGWNVGFHTLLWISKYTPDNVDVCIWIHGYQSLRYARLLVVRIPLLRSIPRHDHSNLPPSTNHAFFIVPFVPLASARS